jgi:ATP-dependent DNA ligase
METVMLCDKGVWGEFPAGWLYEKKLDGARALVAKYGNEVKIVGRKRTDYTPKFPEIVADLKTYPNELVILDGEIVGKDYSTLAGRTHLEDKFTIELRSKVEPCDFYAFDILAFDDISEIYDLPLSARKEILYKLGERGHIKIVRPQPLGELLTLVEAGRIEGIVAKDPHSPYQLRRSPAWVKFRKEQVEDLQVIGYEDTDKPTRPYRSLILARGGREVQASSGLSEADLELTSQLFAKEPKHQVGTKWYFDSPHIIAEIGFYGGTEGIPYRFPKVVKLKLEKNSI